MGDVSAMIDPIGNKGSTMAQAPYKGKRVEVEIHTDTYKIRGRCSSHWPAKAAIVRGYQTCSITG